MADGHIAGVAVVLQRVREYLGYGKVDALRRRILFLLSLPPLPIFYSFLRTHQEATGLHPDVITRMLSEIAILRPGCPCTLVHFSAIFALLEM